MSYNIITVENGNRVVVRADLADMIQADRYTENGEEFIIATALYDDDKEAAIDLLEYVNQSECYVPRRAVELAQSLL